MTDNNDNSDNSGAVSDSLGAVDLQLQARRYACELLGVSESATKNELKQAYRRAALKYHPDRNTDNIENNRKFMLVKCAYELLVKGTPCLEINRLIHSLSIKTQQSANGGANSNTGANSNNNRHDEQKYNLDNQWGHFLWWKEKYFDGEYTPENKSKN